MSNVKKEIIEAAEELVNTEEFSNFWSIAKHYTNIDVSNKKDKALVTAARFAKILLECISESEDDDIFGSILVNEDTFYKLYEEMNY